MTPGRPLSPPRPPRGRAVALARRVVGLAALLLLPSAVPLRAQNVEFQQTSLPAGVVVQTTYPLPGTRLATVAAPVSSANYRFTHWTLNGARANLPTGRAANPVYFTITDATAAVAVYLPETQDTDADGWPDWEEIHYLGGLQHGLDDDPDGDGLSVRVERQRGLDPSAPDQLDPGGVSRRRHGVTALEIPDTTRLDDDRDGLLNYVEAIRGYNPLVPDTLEAGGVSRRRSPPVHAIGRTGFVILRETSLPAGVVSAERVVPVGATVPLTTAPLAQNGWRWTGWFVDGRRVDPPPLNQPIPLTVTSNTLAVARYILETADTDQDGLSDWTEWLAYDSLEHTSGSDPDADGLVWAVEQFRGYSPLARDELEPGGLSRRRGPLLEVNPAGDRFPYVMRSLPAGMVSQSGWVLPGTPVSTPDLRASTAGNDRFAYWTMNGIRQADPSGYSRPQVTLAVTGAVTLVAHYFNSSVDDDFDGLADWYERVRYGTTVHAATSDTDGDGFSLANEAARGYEPGAVDGLMPGGISRRRSPLTAVNTVLVSAPPNIAVNAASELTPTSARLSAQVNPRGVEATAYFEWGLTPAYGNSTVVQEVGAGLTPVGISVGLGGLNPATVHHFRVVAENARGVSVSPDHTFSTLWQADAAESFDDPSAIGRWQRTGGLWASGVPVLGPGAAFSGAGSVGAVLDAPYAPGADGRLITPVFQVPALSEHPRFGFQHWWDLGAGDYGLVEIRRGTVGAWEPLATFQGAGGAWMDKEIDLSAQAGLAVQLSFRLVADADAQTGAGWFLDDLGLRTGPRSLWDSGVADGFEGPEFWRDWTVTGRHWSAGEPVGGPGAAAQGGRVAAVALRGNAPDNASTRLVSPFFQVADAGQNPRLRYWHWHQFGSGDTGRVEAREPGGPWTLLDVYSGSSGSAWARPSLPLGDFGGKVIQVAFRFDSNASGPGPGWFVDQVAQITGAEVFLNPETFDGEVGEWTTDVAGVWQIGVPASGPGAAVSGARVAATQLGGPYPANAVARLQSPAFQVADPGLGRVSTLSFQHWHAFGAGDSGKVQVSVESGGVWSSWIPLAAFTGSGGGWRPETVDLTAHKGRTVRLGFLLEANADASTGAGWYLDNVAVSSLVLGRFAPGLPAANSLPAGEIRHYYLLEVPEAGPLVLDLAVAGAPMGTTGLYLRRNGLPSPGEYDQRAVGAAGQLRLLVPHAAAGEYHVLVHAAGRTAAAEYTLTARRQELVVDAVTPALLDTRREMVVGLRGAGFVAGLSVELVDTLGQAWPAQVVEVDSFGAARAGYGAHTLPAGRYSLRASLPGGAAVLVADAVELRSLGEPRLVSNLVTPSALGRNTAATLHIQYRNEGDAPMPSPLVHLSASGGALLALDAADLATALWTTASPAGFSGAQQFFGDADGILDPGESITVPVYFGGQRDGSATGIEFLLGALLVGDPTPVDWSALRDVSRPESVSPEAWRILWSNFTAMAGSTWGAYAEMLAASHAYLRGLGEEASTLSRPFDTGTLLGHRFLIANGLGPVSVLDTRIDASEPSPGLPLVFSRHYPQGILERHRAGLFGRGWVSNWDLRLRTDAGGAVEVLGPGASQRRFEPDSRRPGQFFSRTPGDHAVLRLVSGAYQLREKEGLLLQFRSDLRLGYVEDANGNRITAGYTGEFLSSLTHTSGATLSLVYTPAGRLASVTDSLGRATTYAYDATGEYLESVTDADGGVTTYAYQTVPGSAWRHALTRVAGDAGPERRFAYDHRGWLEEIAGADGAEPQRFLHDGLGKVTLSNAVSQVSTLYFDHRGAVVKSRDALGHVTRLEIDNDLNLVAVTDPAGRAHRHAYDAFGNVVESTDPLGAVTRFTYTSSHRLASVTDALGRTTRYAYDSRQNVRSITHADLSHEDWTYAATGDPLTWSNRRGQVVGFEHDARGRLTRKTYPDGTETRFTYDARGNLDRAANAQGETDLDFDAHDRLVRITDPQGHWLAFTYDGQGRRATREDDAGNRVVYEYDSQGRLFRLLDGTGVEIVRHQFDAAGRLVRTDRENGVYSLQTYDALGRLAALSHHAPGGDELHRFAYAHDSRGRRVRMETREGVWTYSHDDLGQLTRATLDSSVPAIPDQDLAYVYDAVGNRVRVTENGVVSDYTVNALNQYVQVGESRYSYDLDGNLVEARESRGTTLYAYDAENRMTSAGLPGGVEQYLHNAFGIKVGMVAGGETTRFVVDPSGFGEVAGVHPESGPSEHRVHDAGWVALDVGGTRRFPLHDPMGNRIADTGPDGRILADSQVYEPFGRPLSPTPDDRPGFAGRYGIHPVAGGSLLDMRQRMYHPGWGRFIAPDPLGILGGDLQLYRYAANSPMHFADPNGTFVLPLAGAGAAIGAVVNGSLYAGKALVGGDFSWRGFAGALASGALYGFVVGGTGGLFHWAILAGGVSNGLGYSIEHAGAPTFDWGAFGSKIMLGASTGWIPWRMLGFNGIRWGIGAPTFWRTVLASNAHGASLFRSLTASWAATEWADLFMQNVPIIVSRDPNDCIGPAGVGPRAFVAPRALLPYRVNFENDAGAAAPAQAVVITDDLDAGFDWTTFRVTEIGFGDQVLSIPADSVAFETQHAFLLEDRPLLVDVYAGIDLDTGRAYCRLYTLDPATGLPPPVDVGFLPPEDGSGRGMGWFSFTVLPKAGLASGTEIRNVALITFDANDPIATNQVDPHDPSKGTDPGKECRVTIDADAPASRVLALDGDQPTRFRVSWSAADGAGGSGLASHTVLVSADGGPFAPWLVSTSASSAVFTGTTGSRYTFQVLSRDRVGNAESGFDPDRVASVLVGEARPPRVTGLDPYGWITATNLIPLVRHTLEFTEPEWDGAYVPYLSRVPAAAGERWPFPAGAPAGPRWFRVVEDPHTPAALAGEWTRLALVGRDAGGGATRTGWEIGGALVSSNGVAAWSHWTNDLASTTAPVGLDSLRLLDDGFTVAAGSTAEAPRLALAGDWMTDGGFDAPGFSLWLRRRAAAAEPTPPEWEGRWVWHALSFGIPGAATSRWSYAVADLDAAGNARWSGREDSHPELADQPVPGSVALDPEGRLLGFAHPLPAFPEFQGHLGLGADALGRPLLTVFARSPGGHPAVLAGHWTMLVLTAPDQGQPGWARSALRLDELGAIHWVGEPEGTVDLRAFPSPALAPVPGGQLVLTLLQGRITDAHDVILGTGRFYDGALALVLMQRR